MPERTCAIPGCPKPPRSGKAEWCKMHYHRWYRHGSTDRVATTAGITASLGRRYKSVYLPDHPLANKYGQVYEHRVVLHAVIGVGPHSCHWCNRQIDWLPKSDPDHIQPDHLNGLGDDNRPENLVPSCHGCNTTRGLQARADALRAAGWWSHNDTVAALRNGGRVDRVA